MARLLLKFNGAVIKEVPLGKGILTVGRKEDNNLVVDSPTISGHHCRVTYEGGSYFVEDLNSTNGTYVNDKKIMKSGLKPGDVIGMANHALEFREGAADGPVSAGVAAPGAVDLRASEPAAATLIRKAYLKVLKGAVGRAEFELQGSSLYIGKSDRAQLQIKGKGLLGSAPEVAAAVHKKSDGYYLMAVVSGYPLVNGVAVSASAPLRDGDLIECGGTTMQFLLK